MTLVKICGLTTPEGVDAAVGVGADYLGFVHFPRSPRHLEWDDLHRLRHRLDAANETMGRRARSVVLLVDPAPETLSEVAAFAPDLIQLHGRETPEQVAAIRREHGLRVIKALPVATAADLDVAEAYATDHLMFDAKPPSGSDRPGGHGATFDWSLLLPVAERWGDQSPAGRRGRGDAAEATLDAAVPRSRAAPSPLRGTPPSLRDGGESATWFLAGGLTPANVGEAIRVTRAPVVDVSSGVESAPGVKDPALIAAFIQAVRNASSR